MSAAAPGRSAGRAAGLAAALLAVLALLAPAAATARPAPATAQPALAEVVVDALAPRVVTAGGPGALTVSGRVVNTGDRRIADLDVRVQRDAALTDDDSVRRALREEPEAPFAPRFTRVSDGLDPGESAPFRLDVALRGGELDSLQIPGPGTYPLLVNLNGTPDFGDVARLASAPLLLPVLDLPPDPAAPAPPTPPPTAPVPLTVLWPLAGAPAQLPTGPGEPLLLAGAAGTDPIAGELSPGGRLDELLTALEEALPPGSPLAAAVCVAVDPELLETVDGMTRGYAVAAPAGTTPGTGAAVAQLWLDRLRAVVAGRCVLPLPYADADLAALSALGLADLQALATGTGARLVGDLLGVQPLAATAWPGSVDERTLADLVAVGTRAVVLDRTAVREPPTAGDAVRLAAGAPGGAPVGLLTDPLVAEALAADGPLAVQDGLGVLVHRARTGGAPVLLAPPRRWSPGAGEAGELLRTARLLLDAGLAAPRDLAGPAAAPDLPGPTALAVAGPPRALPDGLVATRDAVRDLQVATTRDATVGLEPAALLDPVRLALLRAASTAWADDPARAAGHADAAADRLDGLRSGVRLLTSAGPYTLASSDAPLLVTVSNDLPVGVEVQLAVQEVPGLRVGPVGVQAVPARSTRQFVLPAEVSRTGQFTVSARMSTPGGTPLGAPTTLQLRSTAFGTVTVALTGGAGVVLVLLVARRIARRVRAARGGGG